MSKLVIITGGSRGLGKSMALNLARAGRDIIITYHSKKAEAEDVVKEIAALGRKAAAVQLDVSESGSFVDFAETVRKLLKEKFGRVDFDYLINNAGTGVFGMFADTTEEDFTRMFNEHVKAPYFLSQKLVPLMKDGGRILSVSSGLTRVSYLDQDCEVLRTASLNLRIVTQRGDENPCICAACILHMRGWRTPRANYNASKTFATTRLNNSSSGDCRNLFHLRSYGLWTIGTRSAKFQ